MALTGSTPLSRTPVSVPELATRVAVTLGALAIYRLGLALPLPGLYFEQLYGTGAVQAIGRMSVFSLGVAPLVTALLFVELARLVSARFNDWAGASPANARRINHWVLVGALVLAPVQAYGVAIGIESIPNAVDEPGLLFRLTAAATVAGGTALLAWLASLISRYGVGSGLWILLLAPYLADLPAIALYYGEYMQRGILSQAGLVSILVYLLMAAACVVALALVLARRGIALERTLIWPQYMGAIVANFLTVVPWLLPTGPLRETALASLALGMPLHMAVLAAVIIAISLAQSRRAGLRSAAEASSTAPASPAAAAPIFLIALVLAAIAVGPDVLGARLPVSIPFGGIPLAIAAAITVVLILDVKSLSSGRS